MRTDIRSESSDRHTYTASYSFKTVKSEPYTTRCPRNPRKSKTESKLAVCFRLLKVAARDAHLCDTKCEENIRLNN